TRRRNVRPDRQDDRRRGQTRRARRHSPRGCRRHGGLPQLCCRKDAGDANAMWITEVWESKSSHDASLFLQSVKNAIAKGRSLIASFSDSVVTTPPAGTAWSCRRTGDRGSGVPSTFHI